MLTYNALLFKKRQELGLSRYRMAKKIGCSHFMYSMVEKGYFKPSKKLIAKISEKLDIQYEDYLVDEPSYPAELPEKKKMKVTRFLYRVVGSTAFRITTLVLTLLSAGYLISGYVVNHKMTNEVVESYDQEYVDFYHRLQENGDLHIGAVSSLFRPEYKIYEKDEENNTSKYISIIGEYNEKYIGTINISATYRTEDYRLTYDLIPSISIDEDAKPIIVFSVSVKHVVYDLATSYTYSFTIHEGSVIYEPRIIFINNEKAEHKILWDEDPEFFVEKDILLSHSKELISDFNNVLKEKDGGIISIEKIGVLKVQGSQKATRLGIYALFAIVFGILLTGVFAFLFAFGIIYGTRKGVVKDYRPSKLEVEIDKDRPMRTDTKLFPFIPETFLEIVGILMVFIGSMRIVQLAFAIFSGTGSTVIGSISFSRSMELFIIGMFLLYFIDFDIFLDDRRVFRNIVLYSLVFLGLYALEQILLNGVNTDGLIGAFIVNLKLPNMFGTIACYYWIMLFLFYTPKRINTLKKRVIYRCLAIIPISFIFISWLLYYGDGVLFTLGWDRNIKNLFNCEKIPFSLLAVSYLVGLFFLRLFFEKKYGVERARIFFNGNKFIWIKNIMVAAIIVIIGIVEIILDHHTMANKMGLGLYSNLIFLAPILFFYHPHKGPRNLVVDYLTLFFYFIAITTAYVLVVFIVIASL